MTTRTNHEIDYKIYGEELQFVEIELDPNETAIAESGAMMMMDDGIQMQTIFGDGSQHNSRQVFLGKLMTAGKALLTGESLFMTAFTNIGQGKKRVSFAAPYTGKIIPIGSATIGRDDHCTERCFFMCGQRCKSRHSFSKKAGYRHFRW